MLLPPSIFFVLPYFYTTLHPSNAERFVQIIVGVVAPVSVGLVASLRCLKISEKIIFKLFSGLFLLFYSLVIGYIGIGFAIQLFT